MDDNLEQLELELTARPRSNLPTELRARVLHDVQNKLNEEHMRGRWLFAASVAAAFVIWFNLSWFAARETELFGPQTVSAASLDEMIDQIQRLVPELSRLEAGRQAMLLRTNGGLGSSAVSFPMRVVR